MRHARLAFAGAVAIGGALAGGEKGFPCDARGVIDPGLLRLRVAASGLLLLDDVAAGLMEARVNLLQLIGVLNLNAEMVEAGLPARVEIAKLTRGSSSIHLA